MSGDPSDVRLKKLIIERSELKAASPHMIIYHLLHVESTLFGQLGNKFTKGHHLQFTNAFFFSPGFEPVMEAFVSTYGSFVSIARIFKAMTKMYALNVFLQQLPTLHASVFLTQ